MKNFFLTVAILAMGITTAKAQALKFGAKGGMNYASIKTELDDDDSKARLAYHFGAVAEMKVSSAIGVQAEVLYSAQGYKPSEKITIKHDYVNIPLSLKYYLGDVVALEVGPQVGFIVNAKGESDVEIDDSSIIGRGLRKIGDWANENYKESVNAVDMGVNLGVAFHATDNIALGARYTHSLSDVYEETILGKIESANTNIQLSLTYYF